jgi:hypothetical protein
MAPRRSMLRDLTCARFGGFVLVLFGSTSAPGRGNRRLGVVVAVPGSGARVFMVYPRIVSTDVDTSWLLARFGDLGWFGGLARFPWLQEGQENRVIPEGKLLYVPDCGTHAPHFTKSGQEPDLICNI